MLRVLGSNELMGGGDSARTRRVLERSGLQRLLDALREAGYRLIGPRLRPSF